MRLCAQDIGTRKTTGVGRGTPVPENECQGLLGDQGSALFI